MCGDWEKGLKREKAMTLGYFCCSPSRSKAGNTAICGMNSVSPEGAGKEVRSAQQGQSRMSLCHLQCPILPTRFSQRVFMWLPGR